MANKVLQWEQHHKQTNVWIAHTPAYQYKMLVDCFGRTTLRILKQGDRPSATPQLLKEYRERKNAETAARRWERKYGGVALADRIAAGVGGLYVHLDVSIILTKKEVESYCLAYGLDPENEESVRSDILSLLRERIGEASPSDEYTWTVEENS